jgi:hypothetical protein
MHATSHTAAAGGMHNEKLLPLIKQRRCFLFLLSLQPKFENAALKSHRVLSLSRHYSIYTGLMWSAAAQQKLPGTWNGSSKQPTQPASSQPVCPTGGSK